MATVALTTAHYRHLVRLLAESAGILTAVDRQNLLEMAGLGDMATRLHFDTNARSFAVELVRELQSRGTLDETGQPALVSLLRLVREIVAGNEEEAAFLDVLLAPYPDGTSQTAEDRTPAQSSTQPSPQTINYFQTIYNTGSAQVAQGQQASALGERAVQVTGDQKGGQIVTGDSNTVGGGQAQRGGIRVGKIDGKKVTVGVDASGDIPPEVAALGRAFLDGNVTVDEILNADDVTVGLRYVSNPQQPTLPDLRNEIAALRSQLETALTNGELPDRDAGEDAAADLAQVEEELEKEEPNGGRVVRRLKGVAEILETANQASDAAKGLATTAAKLAPYAITLLALARRFFGLG